MLNLKQLTMTNFGPIEGTKIINFNSGINLINAPNGTGKSTADNAIEILLLNNYESSLEQYINWNHDSFSIILNFDIDNKNYNSVH